MGVTTRPQVDSLGVLENLRAQAQTEVIEAERTLGLAQEAHRTAVERLSHVQALLRLSGANQSNEGELRPPPPSASPTTAASPEVNGGSPRASAGDTRAVDAAEEVLRAAGKPLHYREIYAAIEREGVLIRSSNPANTLLTRMLRDGRFGPSGQRGFYELVSDGTHQHYRPQPPLMRKGSS